MSRIPVTFICASDRCSYFKSSRTRAIWNAWADLSPFVKGEAKATVGDGGKCAYCGKQGEAR